MRRVFRWLDERVDLASARRALLDRKMPGGLTWWHTLGSATLAVFSVQVVTGIVLAMSYSASPDHAWDSIVYLQQHVLSGALVRGMHHWGASAMVVLVLAHMIRVFTMGSYKYPREVNWVLGVGLFFIVMGFGFTGYLLPWDQKAYWATQVGTNIAGTTPVIGETLVKLLRGGTQLGAATLARFYALHVLLLPVLLVAVVLLHLTLVVRQGIAPRAHVLEANAPARTSDPAYGAYYEKTYAASKGEGVPFWPNIIAKDLIVATAAILVLVLLGHFAGAGLEPPADPTDTAYVPRPEWYFLPFYQLLKLVPGSMEAAVAAGTPALIVLVLLMLPFFDRRSTRMLAHRPLARITLFGVLGASAFLIGASVRDEPPAVPPEVGHPLNSVQRAGRLLFKAQQCGSCHAVAGVSIPDRNADVPDAPDLTDIGLHHSSSWMHSFLEDPSRFHADSKMPAFGPPTLSHEEIEEIAQYLATLRGPHGDTKEAQFVDTFPEPKKLQEQP